ncbi:hypothetical protein OSB04_021335 [Centaurea solstitialis]|uniref:Uncharacterized protein n=1 Tax=Centaurea solstitialis TaxID=347529 RepID=A0AA38W6P0_9ASTR|nr:hypothetical protein OSB04_021335 [Centaurea solstitialis]
MTKERVQRTGNHGVPYAVHAIPATTTTPAILERTIAKEVHEWSDEDKKLVGIYTKATFFISTSLSDESRQLKKNFLRDAKDSKSAPVALLNEFVPSENHFILTITELDSTKSDDLDDDLVLMNITSESLALISTEMANLNRDCLGTGNRTGTRFSFPILFSFSISTFNCHPLLIVGHRHHRCHRRRRQSPPPPPPTAVATVATIVPFLSPPHHRRCNHPPTTAATTVTVTVATPSSQRNPVVATVVAVEATAVADTTVIAVEATATTAVATAATAVVYEATAPIVVAAKATVVAVKATTATAVVYEATTPTVVVAEATVFTVKAPHHRRQ